MTASLIRTGHRERLLAAATRCLTEKGYARTTARDLVAVSQTNLGSIGYHFGGKEALLNEAIAAGFRTWTAEVERAAFAEERGSPIERLQRSLAAMVDRFGELHPFLVAFVEAFPQAVRDPALRDQMAGAYAEAREAGTQMVARALAEVGQRVSSAEATALSSIVMALCDGLILQWLVDPEATPGSDEIVASLLASLPPRAQQ